MVLYLYVVITYDDVVTSMDIDQMLFNKTQTAVLTFRYVVLNIIYNNNLKHTNFANMHELYVYM